MGIVTAGLFVVAIMRSSSAATFPATTAPA
jgi:hypothetical protein